MKTYDEFRLSKQQFVKEWNEWIETGNVADDPDLRTLIMDLKDGYSKIINDPRFGFVQKKDYYKDYMFGLFMYDYFSKKNWFSLRTASDADFWRFLSVKVVPDIVKNRYDCNPKYYGGGNSNRIWLKTIWWFIHLSWQGTLENTRRILLRNQFTTDTILNLGDRSGRNGVHVDTYRKIVQFYAEIPSEYKSRSQDLFRTVMKLNTAKILSVEPSLCSGGEEEYVRTLFSDAGVKL